MSFRRFLYLVADECAGQKFSLRRIDTSRFFFLPRPPPPPPPTEWWAPPPPPTPTPLDSRGGAAGHMDPSAAEDAGRLPDPTLSVSSPELKHPSNLIDFILFNKNIGHEHAAGGESPSPAVVTIDHSSRTLMCDPGPPHAVFPLGTILPKVFPFSLTAGGSLYVMDLVPKADDGDRRRSFEALSYSRRQRHLAKEWYWHTLPPPPFAHGPGGASRHVESYAVAGDGILVSTRAGRTWAFDTARREWRKAGDWAMPFSGLAERVPEHGLWFGISARADGSRFTAANLLMPPPSPESEETTVMGRPPVVHGSWKEFAQPPPEWSLVRSQAVYLGSSKFCIVRFFEVGELRVFGAMIVLDTGKLSWN